MADGWQRERTGKPFYVWDAISGRLASPERFKQWGYGGVALSPDGSLLATHLQHPGRQEDVGIWNVATGKLLAQLEQAGGQQMVFSPDGKWLAVRASDDIGLWDTATWKRQALLVSEESAWHGEQSGESLAFSPDSHLLAVGETRQSAHDVGILSGSQTLQSEEATSVQIWDVQARRKLQTLGGTTGPVLSLAFSPDGKMLAAVDRDLGAEGQGQNSALLLWDAQTWQMMGTIAVERDHPLRRVAWASDSATLLTASYDRVLKFWSVPRR